MASTIVRTKGLSDLRMIEVEHPLGGIEPDELHSRIARATELAQDLLANG
jgi:hypothetical protein